MKAKVLIMLLSLSLFCSCGPTVYEKVATSLEATANAVATLQTVISQGNLQGSIPDQTARSIMEACVRINKAGLEAINLTRQLHQLGEADRVTIFQIIHPVLATVDNVLTLDLTGVNPDLQAKIKMAIGLMQLTLRAVESALVSGQVPAEELNQLEVAYAGI